MGAWWNWPSIRAATLAVIGLVTTGTAQAAELPQPSGKPVLTVVGNIGVTNRGDAAVFDIAMLEALGTVSVETTTPWYEGKSVFEGVPLARIVDAVGASGDRIVAVALNEYSAEIPMQDARTHNVLLAFKRNGEYMPVRDKGPLFVIYPFDSDSQLRSQVYYSRSVWQLHRLEFK